MDELIKQAIENRKKTLFDYFDIPAKAMDEVNGVFERMRQLGEQCANIEEFETQLAKSQINADYNNLFKVNARHLKLEHLPFDKKEMAKEVIKDSVKDTVKQQARNSIMGFLVNWLPAKYANILIYKWNMIPGVSKFRTAKNLRDMIFRNFKKNKP